MPMVAASKDAPKVAFSTRAMPKLAEAVAENDEAKDAALSSYGKDKFSAAAPCTRSSACNAWHTYHEKWFGVHGPEVLPLAVQGVAAILRQL